MIHHGDLFDVLPTLDADSVDACVSDPPYGIGFMGREWDTFAPAEVDRVSERLRRKGTDYVPSGAWPTKVSRSDRQKGGVAIEYDRSLAGQREFQAWTERWAREVFRVLKPGAYAVICGAPRSAHRMACGLEDAGFIVRDCFAWLFGQGFPKSLDIARAVDMSLCTLPGRHCMRQLPPERKRREGDHVCPETDLGRQWAGWGSGLKPAHEPIYVARKPLAGTLAENIEAHGTGALNIAACRIAVMDDDYARNASGDRGHAENRARRMDFGMTAGSASDLGRWPSNVLLDEIAAMMLDHQSGELVSGANPTWRGSDKFRGIYSEFVGQDTCTPMRGQDIGGASRFFYVAKPSRAERDMGCEHLPPRKRDESRQDGDPGGDNPRNRGLQPRGNHHPTVKPVELMRWLVRLVTPPGGVVLDPFTGSGTTGMACVYEDRRFIGIEREAEYVEIAERRIRAVAPLFAEVSA